MNIVLKNIHKILEEKRLTKIQKNTLEKTKKFAKKYDIKIIDSRVNFLTIKILNLNKNLENIKEVIKKSVC